MLRIDPITLEIYRHRFKAIPEEMGLVLEKAAFSANIRERLDHSCAIFDAEARMIAQAAHIPVHLGSMPDSVSHAIQAFDDFSEGDVILLNSPYSGGTHLPDITSVSPVFIENDLNFFVASRAHHADVGGMSPGSLPLSTEIYQEGIIIPPIKVVDGSQTNHAALQLITTNSRTPTERLYDLNAQIACQNVGVQRLQELVDQHNAEVFRYAEALIAYSRRLTEAIILKMPNGVYTFEDSMEGDGQQERDLSIKCTVEVSNNRLSIDFTGTSDQTIGNINAVPSIVESAILYCVRLLADIEIPMNYGCFEPISIQLPEHSLLNPDYPAGVALSTTETSQRIVDVVLGAFAKIMPNKVPAASQGTMNNVTFGGIHGKLPFTFYETIAGGHGASSDADGLSARQSHMTNTRNTPVEAIETTYPVRIVANEIIDGSGGDGEYVGGHGLRRIYQFLVPAVVTLNTERRINPPYGLHGGNNGQLGQNYLIRHDERINLSGKTTFTAQKGDLLIIETPGGGGWGINKGD